MRYFLALISICIILKSCKSEDPEVILHIDDTRAIAAAEMAMAESFSIVNNILTEQGNGPSCANITIEPNDTSTFPKTITIEYPEYGCFEYGKTRKGRITLTVSKPWDRQGAVVTFIPQNFTINDVKIEGTQTYTNNGANNNGETSYVLTVNNGAITGSDYFCNWNSERAITIRPISGNCSITGKSTGTTSSRVPFIINIIEPLIKSTGCPYIEKGYLHITHGGKMAKLDFGNGLCDG